MSVVGSEICIRERYMYICIIYIYIYIYLIYICVWGRGWGSYGSCPIPTRKYIAERARVGAPAAVEPASIADHTGATGPLQG